MDDLDAAIDGLTQKPVEEEDPIGAAVDNVISMDKARTGGAIRSAIAANPDQAAQAKAIASRAGLPQDVVLRNLPEMQAKDTAARIDAVSERSEVLSRMFRERPDFGPVVHDDVDNLSAIERIVKGREQRAAAPIDVFRTGKAYGGALAEGVIGTGAGGTASGLAELGDIQKRAVRGGLRAIGLDSIAAGMEEADARIPAWLRDPGGALMRTIGGAAKAAGEAIGPAPEDRSFGTDMAGGIGQLGFQIATSILTGGTAAIPMLAAQGADSMAQKVADDEATQAEKDVAVLLGAGWTAVTEKYGLDKILNRVPPAVKNAALRRVADIAAGAGIEAAQEAAEALGQDVIRRVFTNPEAEIGEGILQEAGVAGTVGGIVRAALGIRMRGTQAQQAKEAAASMGELDKLAEASKVRQRSPEDWQAFMQAVSEDGPVKDVYIDARDLDEAALAQLVAASPAAAQQAAESLASGVDMQIPVAEFGSSVAGQGFAQTIIPHLKTDPNGMSATQADEYLKTAKEDTERTVNETLGRAGQEDAFAAGRAAVESDVLRQLNETGRFTEAVNKPQAALWAARYATLGARLGITPEEAYKRYPATVTAAPPTGEALAQPRVEAASAVPTGKVSPITRKPIYDLRDAAGQSIGLTHSYDTADEAVTSFNAPKPAASPAATYTLPAPDLPKRSNWKQVKGQKFTDLDEDDGFLYHVTAAPNAAGIREEGLMPGGASTFGGTYEGYSRGKVFLTERSGVSFWKERVEQALFHGRDNPPAVVVMRIPKNKITATLTPDEAGTKDARARAYSSTEALYQEVEHAPAEQYNDADGLPVIRSADVEIAYAQPTERLELIPVEGQQLYNMAIMAPSNEYLGYVELLYENGKLTGLYDIEIENDGRRDGVGTKVIEAILASDPQAKILISNVVPAARGFWAKVGVPEQNVGEGDAYDDYLDWNTYAASEAGQKRGAKALGGQGQGGAGAAGVQAGSRGQAGGVLAQQVDQTETPEFKRWFGDSKVVDADGKPLVVYHGTSSTFDKFSDSRPNFFSASARYASAYGAQTVPVYLRIAAPFDPSTDAEALRIYNEEFRSDSLGRDAPELQPGRRVPFTWADEFFGFLYEREALAPSKTYDGIVVDEGAGLRDEYGDAGAVAWVPLENTQIKSAIGNRGTFDPNDPSILAQADQPVSARGPQRPQVRGLFTPSARNVALLEQANLTTFVHESGHLFLDQTAQIAAEADAPSDIKADMQTLLDWFGIKAEEGASQLQVWQRMTVDQQREHHEKFARGFEAFAFEGKAPSTALAGAFQRFRGWLRNWYRSLAGLNVQLTDEVRAVMSRMVATDVEIEQARASQSMGLMFDQAAADKLGIDYRAYQELDRDAADDAATELDKRRLNDLKWFDNAKSAALRARQREVADIRRDVKAEARSVVMAQPVYRAWSFLTGKAGEAVVPGVTVVESVDTTEQTGKLRTSALKEMMGDAPDAAWRKLVGLRMTNDTTGMHPDIVAELFGYASGQEMVAALVNAPDPQLAIEAQTDSLLLQRYGDITSPQEMERAAIEAVHNQARAKVIATELNALEKAAKTSKKTVTTAAKTFAEQVVGRQNVGDLKPEKFEAAARKAGQASMKAFKAGDIQKAATEKRNELINTYAARIARDAKADIDKKLKTYTKAANKPIADIAKTRDADTVQAMRAILAEYGIGRRGEPAQKYIDALKAHDPDTHARLSASIETLTANAKDYKALSVEDFQALADDIDVMWRMSRRSRQMEIDGDMIDAQEAQEAVRAQLEKEGVPTRIAGEGQAVTEGEKTTAILRSARAALRRVESWVYARDGGPQGAFRKYVFNPIKTGSDNYRAAQAKYRKRYLDLLSGLDLKGGRIDAPELGYVFGYSKGGSGKQEILHAILHTGNDSNKRKLLLGRQWATLNADDTIDTARWDGFVKRMIDQGVITKADYDFAQGVWDLLEETKAGAQKTHREVFGRSFDEVTANSFVTPFGAYRGGYVPAMADPDAVSDAKTRAILEEENQTMAQAFPSTAKGFTKGRTEYNKALLLDLRSLAGHLDKVLMFTHLEAPVRDVRRLLGHDSVRTPLSRMDSSAYDGMLIPWLNRSARQQTEAPVPAYNGVMKWLSKARSRAGMSSMIGNVVNAAQQVTGFAVAAIRVKPRYLRSALVEYIQNPRKTTDRVAEASQYMESRMRNEVAQMNLAIDDILLNPNVYEKAQAWTARHGYFLQSAVDNVMGPIIWAGAYTEAIEQGASELDARRQADSVIRETQGSTLPEDIAAFEAGNSFTRLFTQFQGYFNMQANLLGTEFAKTQREMGLRAGMGRGLYVFALGFLAPALVGQLIAEIGRGGVEDEDGDGYLDDWLASLGIGTAKSAFALVPGAGQAGVLVFNAANNKPYDDRASLSPAVSMVEAAARSPFSVYAAVTGEGSARKAVRDVGSLISLTTGLPGGAVARPLGYAADLATERIAPTGPVDLARGLVTGNPSPESKR